tara:strand:- start:539 stop:769 length:231 start_codon:yes stop_codon:yes gene_type:complete
MKLELELKQVVDDKGTPSVKDALENVVAILEWEYIRTKKINKIPQWRRVLDTMMVVGAMIHVRTEGEDDDNPKVFG